MSNNSQPFTDRGDVFAEIESLAREAQALPGLRKSNAIRIASLGLHYLGEIKKRCQKLGAPPAAKIQADKPSK